MRPKVPIFTALGFVWLICHMIPLGVDLEFCLPSDGPGFKSGERMFLLLFVSSCAETKQKKLVNTSPRGDSNPQPPDPKSDALSIAPLRHLVEFPIKVQFSYA